MPTIAAAPPQTVRNRMPSLSHTTGYAIQALTCLTFRAPERVRADEIAECTGVPRPYLSKILHALARTGLVDSKRGYRGGFVLSRPPEEISLLQIVEAVDGPGWSDRCLLGLEVCSDERSCPAHQFWTALKDEIHSQLAAITLKDVCDFEHRQGQGFLCAPDAARNWHD